MKKLLLTLIIPLLCSAFFLPRPVLAVDDTTVFAQATHLAKDLLTTAVGDSDTLKWTVKSVFDAKVVMRKALTVEGNAFFYGFTEVRDLLITKRVDAPNDVYLGDSRFDNLTIESKIRREGGDVYIDDDVRVNGELNLLTASIGSSEIEDGAVSAADLKDAYLNKHVKTIIVQEIGSDAANGAYLKSAIEDISDASASNRYVVKVLPGTYELASSTITMQDYVSVEGSGPGVTTIKFTGTPGSGTYNHITGANANLSNLTIEGTTTADDCRGVYLPNTADYMMISDLNIALSGTCTNVGIYIDSASQPIVTDVEINNSGADYNYGMFINFTGRNAVFSNIHATAAGNSHNYGTYVNYASVTLEESSFTASGGTRAIGLHNNSSPIIVHDVTALGTGSTTENFGLRNFSSAVTVQVERSTISGDDNSIVNDAAFTVDVGTSRLDGAIDNSGGGTFNCYADYNENYAPLDASCVAS